MTYRLPEKVYLPPELDGKAKNIHARMAIYFDNNIYKNPDERDDSTLYQYMYHIIYMLACRQKYFRKFEDYDAFAIYMATKLYMRYINPNHLEKHGKIVSVLNYCKSLLYPCKVDFQRETFDEVFGVDSKGNPDGSAEAMKASWEESIQESYCSSQHVEEKIIEEIEELPDEINHVLDQTPYRKDKLMRHRLYMSVLLSVLKGSTLSNATLIKLENRQKKGLNNEAMTLDLYKKEMNDCTTLWRLEPKYYNLVHLLTIKTRKRFSQRISDVRAGLRLSTEDVNAVIMSAYGNTLRDDNEEI